MSGTLGHLRRTSTETTFLKVCKLWQALHVYFSEYTIAIQIFMKNSYNIITSLTSFSKKNKMVLMTKQMFNLGLNELGLVL